MHWQNTAAGYCDKEKEFCWKLKRFMSDMYIWIKSNIKENPGDPYWHQVIQIQSVCFQMDNLSIELSIVNNDILQALFI